MPEYDIAFETLHFGWKDSDALWILKTEGR
jgi:hypothetical protein